MKLTEKEATRELVEDMAAAADVTEAAEVTEAVEAVTWTVDKFALYSEEARKGKSNNKSNKVRAETSGASTVDCLLDH